MLLNSIKSGVCDVKLQTIDCHYFQKHSTLHSLRMENTPRGTLNYLLGRLNLPPKSKREREGESLALL